ncbi:MAG: asparagine synthase (glutamine-hydrolyzing) [Candidatus Omnitrophota bacterium]
MCGISGFWKVKADTKEAELRDVVVKMAKSLISRGPDDRGDWVDASLGLALSHRRLSILDLSSGGHQPMLSFCGRYVIVYNGEIYNFKEIKEELIADGARFRTMCDTEVLLGAISRWGIKKTLSLLNGMFAFAVWDKKEQKIFLARDRVGIKPLYYGVQNNILYFASELKAVRANKFFKPEIDDDALNLFFRYSYVPCPASIYKNIGKLRQGCYAVISKDLGIKEECYWDVLKFTQVFTSVPLQMSEQEAVLKTENILSDAVGKRMISDVPLGAFLSGGIDSSLIVALMQKQSSSPVKTFTIGFHEHAYNEAESAKHLAKHLGTDHTELYITPSEMKNVIPDLPGMYDEPFSDSSQVPTFLISKLTKKHVTVSLSGDGGDEVFAGYNRYIWADKVWNSISNLPLFFRKGMKKIIENVSPQGWDRFGRFGSRIFPDIFKHRQFGDKLHKLAGVLDSQSPDDVYFSLASDWKHSDRLVLSKTADSSLGQMRGIKTFLPDFVERMMFYDLVTYLPDDILTKVDRASMAVSLETRVPFLDHRVIEFSKQLPLAYKIKNRRSKWILREILYKYVPSDLLERPKMGFAVPVDKWLRGSLRPWAEDLLSENLIRKQGILNPEPIQKMWKEHLSKKRNWQHHLWDILMFQAWKERWM